MKVNIYEFQSEQRYKINPDTFEIEKDLIYRTNKNPKFVESFETVDMKLQQGDIVKGQVVVGADIVQDGYDVYVYEYTGKNIIVNSEHYKHLKNLLFKANKFKSVHVKRRILKIKKDPDISDLTLTDIEEIYKDGFVFRRNKMQHSSYKDNYISNINTIKKAFNLCGDISLALDLSYAVEYLKDKNNNKMRIYPSYYNMITDFNSDSTILNNKSSEFGCDEVFSLLTKLSDEKLGMIIDKQIIVKWDNMSIWNKIKHNILIGGE